MSDLSLFIPIAKVDEAQRLVYGIATAEHPDKSGEICDYASTKPYYEKWSGGFSKVTDGKSLGNIRAMHGKVAVGKVTDIHFDDDKKQIEVCAKIVDDNEWQKVVEGVYTGFSQGGGYVKRWQDPDNDKLKRYTANPSEISLVDTPCLPTARFEYVKGDGEHEMRKFASVEKFDEFDESMADDIVDAAEMLSILKTGSPSGCMDYINEACDALSKYSDSQARDGHGRWAKIGRAVLAAAGGAAGGAMTGGMMGGATGAVAGALVGAVTQAHRKTTENPSSRQAQASSFLGGAIVGIPAGIATGIASMALSSAPVGATAYRMTTAGGGAKFGVAGQIDLADRSFNTASPRELKTANDLLTNALKNRTKKMSGEDLELRKSVWDELSSLHDGLYFVGVIADMAKTLDSRLTDDGALDAVLDELEKYSDSEARDGKGEWTSGSSLIGRTVRGAVAGAGHNAMAAIPGAAISTLTGGPVAGLAYGIKEVAVGTVVGAAAGAVSSSDNVEANANSAVRTVNIAQGVIGAAKTLRSLASSPEARSKLVQSVKDGVKLVPKVARAVSAAGKSVSQRYSAVNTAVSSASQTVASGLVGATRAVIGYGKIESVAGHLVELSKMGVNIVDVVSAIEEEDGMSTITNDQVFTKSKEMATAAGDETKWPSHVEAARAELEKSAETPKPVLQKDAPATTTVAATETAPAAAPVSDEDGPKQVWLAKDGTHHVKKADALAKNATLDTAIVVDPVSKLFDDIKKSAGVTTEETVSEKTVAYGELRKYLGEEVYDASNAMSALQQIFSVMRGEIAEQENDPSQVIALHDAANRLKDFIMSEIDEDHSDEIGAMLAATAQKLADTGTLEKIGARNSTSDKQHLQAIHDHCVSLGCDCAATKSAPEGDLSKLSVENSELRKKFEEFVPQLTEIATLVKSQADEIAKLKTVPVPPPRLHVVEKGGEMSFSSDEGINTDLAKMFAGLNDGQKAEFMVKLAQQQPMTYGNLAK